MWRKYPISDFELPCGRLQDDGKYVHKTPWPDESYKDEKSPHSNNQEDNDLMSDSKPSHESEWMSNTNTNKHHPQSTVANPWPVYDTNVQHDDAGGIMLQNSANSAIHILRHNSSISTLLITSLFAILTIVYNTYGYYGYYYHCNPFMIFSL